MRITSNKPADATRARMRALAKLPIFLDLQGKRAVLVGGTVAAAWKAELLAAAGAVVHVYAETLCPELSERVVQDERIVHHARTWAVDIFAGAAIALADIETDEEARAFSCAARSWGVPVNVIDKPAFCQFQFGTIVNRSPVIIGISTDGAAPVLGQAIRRRIETLLPPALAEWGQLARDVRDSVMSRLAKGPARRAFWETFAERSFGKPPSVDAKADVEALIADIGSGQTVGIGRVTLVGAGPGDAELLTLKAVRALQSADVILFDDLVSDDVLELARREAKRMLVGKRGQRDSCSQADINALMVKLAKQGKRVVRLKSGDPMIFGRAGEEIAELEAHGIAVDVVPGITTALAIAASLGVSLTHRDHAQSVRFVTGHTRDGELSDDLDWQGLADPATTLVFYMGGRTAAAIATRLIAAGLPATTPVAMVASASRWDETRWHGDLDQLSQPTGGWTVAGRPVIICIGLALAQHNGRQSVPSNVPDRYGPAGASVKKLTSGAVS
jgi:uroporphyrin-III C-methyltransferase / precorrin-2 dehydrogenase / sirohydrochlorin ferrochelatase